jgi:hypothetical protein
METAIPDDNVIAALSTVCEFLSDTIAPVQAAGAVDILRQQPATRTASEIIRWTNTQYTGNDPDASVSDYLFHGISKLYYLVNLQLIPKQTLEPFLDTLKQLLLDYCPEEDREQLQENFSRLGMPEEALSAPNRLIYRQKKTGRSESEIRQSQASENPRERRLFILRDRLKSAVQQPNISGTGEDREDAIPGLIATAISQAQSSEEFRGLQANLKSLGIESGTDQIFRKLGHSLPGWMIPTTGTDSPNSRNPAMDAMRQVIHLAEDRWDSYKRFQDMVQAAIEQFNAGSLARAATMLDLALGMGLNNKLDPEAVTGVRKTAHKSLSSNQLHRVSNERDNYPLLRKILFFFDEFAVPNLLDSLQREEKRDKRRLLLALIEVYGEDARKMAVDRLETLLAGTNVATDWHFARNLLCILTQIPRTGDAPLKAEIELITPLLRLSLPTPLVKEAIRYFGQNRCGESEQLLISTIDKLEKITLEYADSGKTRAQMLSLLDRAIFTLAQYGTPKGYGRAIRHGISNNEKWGDTSSRLAYLGSQDLSLDKEGLALLIQFLKSKLPRKLFGITIQKNTNPFLNAVKALSSTPTPGVRQVFEEIAAQFSGTKFGQAAAEVLKEYNAMDQSGNSAERILTGDLELFGFPDLLQQLSQRQMTGSLTLKDVNGNPAGILSLNAGRLQDCTALHLRGMEAAFQLLEMPMAGTFTFQGQRNLEIQENAEILQSADLKPILAEGMRRYDELQRARAIVPDYALLKRNTLEPPTYDEEDAEFADRIWQKTADGVSPEECEAICPVDSYRVRTLLARWIESGILAVE